LVRHVDEERTLLVLQQMLEEQRIAEAWLSDAMTK